jgi:hypothetical protein
VRVVLKTEGGLGSFAGLAAPFACEGESLTGEQAKRLAELVDRSGLLVSTGGGVAPAARGSRRGADRRRYVLTVEHGEAQRTVELEDPLPAAVAPLVAFVRELQRQQGGPHGR